jgi:tRNA/rRNA methyltransferase
LSAAAAGSPAFILIEPQLGENIGAAARAMANFALKDLRLVAPRDGWPNPKALAAASGADHVIAAVRVFPDERAATADAPRVFATSARPRELTKPVLTPGAAIAEMRALRAKGIKSALLFGGERAGLTNDHISLADAIISVPVNPGFGSLNLAQAVLILAYEWFKSEAQGAPYDLPLGPNVPASREEIHHLFDHLEAELDACGFLFPPDKRPHMVRNIRTTLLRAQLTDQDVRTWRGIIKALAEGPKRRT